LCPDRIPIGTPSTLFLDIAWRRRREEGTEPPRPENAQPTTLTFRKRTPAAGGDVSWDAAGVQKTKGFPGDFHDLLDVYGVSSTSGSEADVDLVVAIEGDDRGKIPLSVGPLATTVRIRAENGTDPARQRVTAGTTTRFRAVVDPPMPGSFRWFSLSPDALEITGAARGESVEVVGRSAGAADRKLVVLFSPDGGGPDAVAVHSVTVTRGVSLADTPFLRFTLRWPDSRVGDAAFRGTPIPLAPERVPYLHPTVPASYRQTIELANTPEALPLSGGAPGEFRPTLATEVTPGTVYQLIAPEHAFVAVTPDPSRAWQRRMRLQDVEAGGTRTYSLPVVLDGDVLRFTPPGGAQQEWGDDPRDLYAVALVPYLRNTAAADLNENWQAATAALRAGIGEYPAFDEQADLPFHLPLRGANLVAAQAEHRAPEEYLRFLPAGDHTYTDQSGHLFLEAFLWREETLTGAAPPQRMPWLPVPKRAFLEGIEALRAAFGANIELEVRTGFVPPNAIGASRGIRNVGGQQGFRVNDTRHMFGDAADLDRRGASFDQQPNRSAAANMLIPWPDTAAAQALRDRFSHHQFERIMVNTAPAAVDRHYVLHVDRRKYDLPFPAGVYQFRVGDLTVANGDQTIFNNLVAAGAGYADVVTVVPQAGAARPNAFYPTNLNVAQPHGHPVFGGVNINPNLDALLGRMDADNLFATINVGPLNVGHDEDVEAIIQELFGIYGHHPSLLGVNLDLEWYNVGAPPDATAVVQGLVAWIRANHPGRVLFLVWFGATVNRVDWTVLQPLNDVVIPIYDGFLNTSWGNQFRNQWGGFVLNTSVLQHVWDSDHNLRIFGHNILIPPNVPNAEFTAALSWLGRMSRLYGCTSFAFQFNEYAQNWAARAANLQPILGELGQ